MLILGDCEPFAAGGVRACFPHPEFPDRCVKVVRNHPAVEAALKKAGIHKRLNPGRRADDNERELEVYREFEREQNPALWRHFPRCYGPVDTDLGPGLVTDFLRGPDGRPAPTLSQRAVEQTFDDSCRKAVQEFQAFLRRELVRTGDVHLSNFVLWSPPTEARRRLYVIDGLGSARGWIWSRWLKPLRRIQIWRKCRRMDALIAWNLATAQTPPVS